MRRCRAALVFGMVMPDRPRRQPRGPLRDGDPSDGRAATPAASEASARAEAIALVSTSMPCRASDALRISGGARRITSGVGALTSTPPARAAASTAFATGCSRTTPSRSPAPRTVTTPGSADSPDRSCSPRSRTRCEHPVAGERVEHRQGRGGTDRVAAERRPVCPRIERRHALVVQPDHGADRQPAGQPLGQREDVRADALLGVRMVSQPVPRSADAGLDLVQDQQGARVCGDPPGRCQVAGRWDDHSGLALDRLEDDRGHVVADRRRQSLDVAEGDERDLARQRSERIGLGRLAGQRQ